MKLLENKKQDKELQIEKTKKGVKIIIIDEYDQQASFNLTIDETRRLRDRLKKAIERLDEEGIRGLNQEQTEEESLKTYQVNDEESAKGFKLFDEKPPRQETELYY